MKKSFVSGLIIVVSATFLSACLNQNQNQNQVRAPQEQQTQREVMDQWQIVADAVAQGKAAQCQIRNTETNQVGDYYMKGEMIRYELTSESDPEQNGAFISDGEYVYSWSQQQKQGMKFKIEDPEDQDESDQEPVSNETDVPDLTDQSAWEGFEAQGFTVDCEIRDVEDSQFAPPSDVQFMDFSEMMIEATENMPQDFDPEQYRGMMGQ